MCMNFVEEDELSYNGRIVFENVSSGEKIVGTNMQVQLGGVKVIDKQSNCLQNSEQMEVKNAIWKVNKITAKG